MTNSLWSSWGTSVIGPMHLKRGMPNQDVWMSCHYSWGHVVVVSDGLGSKPHSDYGARVACLSVFEAAKAYWNNKKAKIEDVLRLIHANWLVKVSPFLSSDCSATCLFVIQMGNQLFLGRLGDGLIAVYAEKSTDCFLMTDNKQNSFSNFTYSLSQNFRFDQWETVKITTNSCSAVVLCTDGIADDIMPEKQMKFAEEFYLHYKDCTAKKRKKEIQKWLKNWPVPGHSDDKTIACLFKKGAS